MKKLLLAFYLMCSSLALAQVKWLSIEEALALQKEQPKKILIDFYTDWCAPCKLMDINTFGHTYIAEYINENYYPVKFDAEGNDVVHYKGKEFTNPDFKTKKSVSRKGSQHQFAEYMKVMGYPSIAYIDVDGKLLTMTLGYYSPRDIESYLAYFAEDEHTKMRYNQYKRRFRGKVKR